MYFRSKGENTDFREVEQEADPEHGEAPCAVCETFVKADSKLKAKFGLISLNLELQKFPKDVDTCSLNVIFMNIGTGET